VRLLFLALLLILARLEVDCLLLLPVVVVVAV
jgi:hypothetical protein